MEKRQQSIRERLLVEGIRTRCDPEDDNTLRDLIELSAVVVGSSALLMLGQFSEVSGTQSWGGDSFADAVATRLSRCESRASHVSATFHCFSCCSTLESVGG